MYIVVYLLVVIKAVTMHSTNIKIKKILRKLFGELKC
jgi:hypothetical protein